MLFLRLAALLATLPVLAHAAGCEGESLADHLSPAQQAELAARIEDTPHPRGLLWQAQRGDAQITLIGTIHVWDARLGALADVAAPLLDGADLVLFEMTGQEQAALVEHMAGDPSLTTIQGPGLNETLAPDEWDALARVAREHGIPPVVASRMRPWLLATTFATPACAMDAMQEGLMGLDFTLMDNAEAAGVPIAALEPWDTVLGLFDKLAPEEEIALLRSTLVAPELEEQMFVAMLDGYFSGDVAAIFEMNRIAMQESGVEGALALMDMAEEELIDARNRAWLPVIEGAAQPGSRIVVAAGAGHLPGKEGLLSLLERAGWVVQRLDG